MLGFYSYTIILTCMGFISGVVGIAFAYTGNPTYATLCLLLAGLFDMFDGKVASTKKNRTEDEKKFGIQIDSLSDLICFGVLPAAIGYAVGLTEIYWFILFAIYPLSALIRLAYFNVMEEKRQKEATGARTQYVGIPVTTVSFVLPVLYFAVRIAVGFGDNPLPDYFRYVYAALLLIFSYCFVSKKLVVSKIRGKALFACGAVFALIIIAVIVAIILSK